METKLYGEIAPGGKWAVPLLLLAVAAYVPGLWLYPLSDAESKYAEIPREMAESGDWVTPTIDYVPYLSKPPLSFWITAGWYKIGGVGEFGARLPNAVLGIALAFVIGAIGRTLFGTRASTIATVFALTTAEFYVYTRECGVEMCLVFFTALTHHCFLRWQRTENRKWLRGAWASAAFASLAKGPIGVLFPFLSIFLYLLLTRQHGQFRRLFSWVGLICFVGIALPWPIAMGLRNPDFFWFAFVDETWYRALGRHLPNDALYPTGAFLVMVAAQFYPWVQHVPQALARGLRQGVTTYDRHCAVYLLSWAVVPLVVFSLSASKVPFYGLQSYPALLLLVAWLWEKRVAAGEGAPSKAVMASTFLICAALAGTAWYVVTFRPDADLVAGLKLPAAWEVDLFLKVAFVGNLIAGVLLLVDRPRTAIASIAAMMAAFFAVAQVEFAQETSTDSMQFAFTKQQYIGAKTVLVCDERPEFAHIAILPFYANQADPSPRKPAYMLRRPSGSRLQFHDRDPRTRRVIDEADLVRWVGEGKDVFFVGDRARSEARFDCLGLKADREGMSEDRAVYRIRRK